MSENGDASPGRVVERTGDALRDGDVGTALELIESNSRVVIWVQDAESTHLITGEENGLNSVLEAVSNHFGSWTVSVEKHRRNTYFGTGDLPGVASGGESA
jgi:hypothetical protein